MVFTGGNDFNDVSKRNKLTGGQKMKKLYTVYGHNFFNKKDATLYHLKIYGAANWQASTVYNFTTHKVENFNPVKKYVHEYLKDV